MTHEEEKGEEHGFISIKLQSLLVDYFWYCVIRNVKNRRVFEVILLRYLIGWDGTEFLVCTIIVYSNSIFYNSIQKKYIL